MEKNLTSFNNEKETRKTIELKYTLSLGDIPTRTLFSELVARENMEIDTFITKYLLAKICSGKNAPSLKEIFSHFDL